MRPSITPSIKPAVNPSIRRARCELSETLWALAPSAAPSELWRGAAFALLRLNPRECEGVALVFEDEAATDHLRGLVLDLLAGAGTFEAQVVMRRLLSLAVARRTSRTFAGYVQRLGFVGTPDGPTLRFLMSVYAESRDEAEDVRAACAYALGAAAGNALSTGDPETAVRASDVLRRDLLTARSIFEKCALLTALGNAGVATDVMAITRFTHDAQASVRGAAALALRKMAVPEARAQLIALVADRESKVAESALVALEGHKLDDAELERLSELVLGGRTALAIDERVLRLLVRQRTHGAASVRRASAVEMALRMLLVRIEAATPDGPKMLASGERQIVSSGSAISPKRTEVAAATVIGRPLPYSGSYRMLGGERRHP